MSTQLFDIVKPRKDRNDEDKTHWDPIGVIWIKDAGEEDQKAWGQIYSIGDINVFPRKPKGEDNPY